MPISFTFDDGRACQVTPGSKVLDEFGLKGTFYVCPGLVREERCGWRPGKTTYELASWAEIKDASRRGHEIGNHSWTHPDFRTETRPARKRSAKWLANFAKREIVAPAREIRQRIPEWDSLSWAWPCHRVASPMFKWIEKQHVGVRPLKPRGPYSALLSEDEHLRRANEFADMVARTNQWGVATIHAMDGGEGEFSEDLFRKHLEHVVEIQGLEVKTVREVFIEASA